MNDNKPFDLVSIGDSTIDTFIRIHDATVEYGVNHQEGKICIPYGAKIPVDKIAYGVAGNAANVAVGTARLGLKTAIYTNLGDDDQGKRIREAFEKEGVDTRFVKTEPDKKTNLSVVLTFQGERTIFVYHQDWSYHLPDIGPVSWVYLTSMAETFTSSNIVDEVYHFVAKTHAKLAFGPGTYQLKAGIGRYPKILEVCEILIVNMEEAKKILDIGEGQIVDTKDILSKLLMLGPKHIVITDGAHGSYATNGQNNLKLGIIPVEVIEKTGAGDAYTSGLLAALARGETLAEAMVWGTINASFEIRHVGTQVGLLKLADLEKERKKHGRFKAVNF
ncbi:MAG: carbohydrate kinase family protein [Candidatus Curtissbacteria bacterium]|nr:carbohydrate kinase family protein [Candidatus Curtissbacteria bacterium]